MTPGPWRRPRCRRPAGGPVGPEPLEGVPVARQGPARHRRPDHDRGLALAGRSRAGERRRPRSRAVRSAGGIVVAKTATYELGCGDEQIPLGPVRNPWNPSCITGGSSAGSAAALAARDWRRWRSARTPADRSASRRPGAAPSGSSPPSAESPGDGLLGLAPTLDAVGPMARTATDAATLLSVLSGDDPAPRRPVVGRLVGVLGGWFTDVLADDVRVAWSSAVAELGELGAELVPIEIADAPPRCPVELRDHHGRGGPDLRRRPARPVVAEPSDVAWRSVAPSTTRRTPTRCAARRALTHAVTAAIAGCDVVVAPACVQTAPPFDDVDRPGRRGPCHVARCLGSHHGAVERHRPAVAGRADRFR